MSRRSSAARIGAQTTTGGVVVVANSSTIGSSSALPDAAWTADRIHQDPRDTAQPGAAMAGEQIPRWLAARVRRLRGDRGSSAIELAILAPVLLILVMLVIQWVLWFQARQVALNVAQDGARYAREQQPGWPQQAVGQAESFYARVGTKVLTDLQVQVNPPSGAPNRVYVTVTGHVPTLIPGMSPLTVRETSGGDVECFRPASTAGQQCG